MIKKPQLATKKTLIGCQIDDNKVFNIQVIIIQYSSDSKLKATLYWTN